MKNKIAALVLASMLALGAVACGGGGGASDGGTEPAGTTGTEATS